MKMNEITENVKEIKIIFENKPIKEVKLIDYDSFFTLYLTIKKREDLQKVIKFIDELNEN